MSARRSLLLTLVAAVVVAAALGILLVPAEHGAPWSESPPAAEAPEQAPGPPILLGRSSESDPLERWWLDIAVVEGEERAPVIDTPLTFLLWLAEVPQVVVPVERTTDGRGRVRIGPILRPVAEATVQIQARSEHYDIGNLPAQAEKDPFAEHTLRATCRVHRITTISGLVELPTGVPAESAVVWRRDGSRHWSAVPLDEAGRFHHRGWGRGPVTLEAAVAWQGARWYGRATVAEGASDARIEVSTVRPGDPALLHLRVEGPGGAPVASWVTVTRTTTGWSALSASASRNFGGRGALAFLYEPDVEVKLEARGRQGLGLGNGTLDGLSADQTEATLVLPAIAEPDEGAAATGDDLAVRELPSRPEPSHGGRDALLVRFEGVDFEDRGALVCLAGGRSLLQHVRLDADGRAAFSPRPDLSDLQVWISGLRGGRYAWAQDLDALAADDASRGRVVAVPVKVGGTVRGTVRCADGSVPSGWSVMATGPAMSFTNPGVGTFPVTHGESTFEVLGVPPGPWEFTLWYETDGGNDFVFFPCRVGEDVVLDIPPK